MIDVKDICELDVRKGKKDFPQQHKHFLERLENILYPPAIEGANVLDIACGVGVFAKACVDLGASEYVGFDINKGEIDKGNEYFSDMNNVQLVHSDLKDVDLGTWNFDTVLVCGILYSLSNPLDFLAKIVDHDPHHIIVETVHSYEEGIHYHLWKGDSYYTAISRDHLNTFMAHLGYTPVHHAYHDISRGRHSLHNRYTVTYEQTVQSVMFLTDRFS